MKYYFEVYSANELYTSHIIYLCAPTRVLTATLQTSVLMKLLEQPTAEEVAAVAATAYAWGAGTIVHVSRPPTSRLWYAREVESESSTSKYSEAFDYILLPLLKCAARPL